MKTLPRIILYGEKREAAKFVPTAKKLLATDKKNSITGFVSRWIKTTGGVLIGFKSIGGVDSIFIRAIRKIFAFNKMEGSFPYWTGEACTGVSFWEKKGYVAGVYATSTPNSTMIDFLDPIGHGPNTINDCIWHREPTIGSNTRVVTGPVVDSLTATTTYVRIHVAGFQVGDTFDLQAFVWDLDDNIVSTGTAITRDHTTINTDSGSNDMPVSYAFSKPVTYRFGAIITSTPARTLTFSNIEIEFTDPDTDIRSSLTNYLGGITKIGDKGYFDTNARPYQLFTSPLYTAVDFSRQNLIFRISNPPIPGSQSSGIVGVIQIYKYNLSDTLVDVLSVRVQPNPIPATFDTWWAIDVKFLFSVGEIRFEMMDTDDSPFKIPVPFVPPVPASPDDLISDTFLVSGFKYTVGYLKHAANADFSDGFLPDLGDTVQAWPVTQRENFDSWYTPTININSQQRGLPGLNTPAWLSDTVLLGLNMNGVHEDVLFPNRGSLRGNAIPEGTAQIDTTADPFSDGRGSLLLDGSSKIVFSKNKRFNFRNHTFSIELWIKTVLGNATLISGAGWSLSLGGNNVVFNASVDDPNPFFRAVALNAVIDVFDGVWHHIAVSRVGDTYLDFPTFLWRGNWRLFVDGNIVSTDLAGGGQTESGDINYSNTDIQIGQGFVGNIDDVIINERGKYFSNFIPSTVGFN